MGPIVPCQRPEVSGRRIAEILLECGVRYPVVIRDPANGKGTWEETGERGKKLVAGAGIEPATHGFSVRCSTN